VVSQWLLRVRFQWIAFHVMTMANRSGQPGI
jgi:hypothetical protein